MHLLALSGSLRADSTNTALLRAAGELAPADASFMLYTDIAALPAFNPDHDTQPAHAAVARFRAALQSADGVLIASPEYAHGVPGALKNALDWVVASGELVDKPVALLHASPRGQFVRAALAEILLTMSARLIDDATLTVPLLGRTTDEMATLLAKPDTRTTLRSVLQCFADGISATPKPDFGSEHRNPVKSPPIKPD
ncbi:NADPH-dependent FMN reductase [Crenobacter sp. SG2305]|uniref:NADPH-dependent FMN reductase n=1 Tax=Crenobacter oryzisoli TaxID=3056844 RepID=UPI0025AB117D|nr:NADPH-dependent FMN reductase [Crenobacter sp. SG2305]MDN0082310.1 NADPH-dependent FMN reductase [Crenobacter sp. SG2305]